MDKGITNPNPVIYATISDASGINTVGNGIGHDITGVIDDNVSEPLFSMIILKPIWMIIPGEDFPTPC